MSSSMRSGMTRLEISDDRSLIAATRPLKGRNKIGDKVSGVARDNASDAANYTVPADVYQRLVQSITDYAIYMLDLDGRVVTWNAGAQRAKGYTAEEIVGRHFSCFYTDVDRLKGAPMANLDTARREGKYESEGWRVRKDGSLFWAHVVIDALRDPRGELFGFAKITRDRSDQRRLAQQAEANAQALLAASQQQEQRFRALVEGVTDYAIYLLDPSGIVSNWNAGAQRAKQYRASEIVGQYFGCFYSQQDQLDGLPALGLELARTRGKYNSEGWRIRKDGTRFWANVVIQPVYDDAGVLFGFAKITRDCTEQREAAERIHYLAHHDALTGLPNRPAFQDRLREALAHAPGRRSGFALFYLDLDGFKIVNDTLGHHGGDALLQAVSARFADVLAKDEYLSRLGGDEFTIISMRCHSVEDTRLLAHKCIQALAQPFDIGGDEVCVGVSIGVVSQAFSIFDCDTVLQQADLALYKAKRGGRNQYRLYEPEMNNTRPYS